MACSVAMRRIQRSDMTGIGAGSRLAIAGDGRRRGQA